jgi:hypothetical protein
MYAEADLTMKERALKTLQAPSAKTSRFQPKDRYLPFWKDFDYARLTK